MLPHASMSSGRRGVALDRMGVASAGSGVGHGGTDEHGWGRGGRRRREVDLLLGNTGWYGRGWSPDFEQRGAAACGLWLGLDSYS